MRELQPPIFPLVMPGLVPGIRVFPHVMRHVDGRDEPSHDDRGVIVRPSHPHAALAFAS